MTDQAVARLRRGIADLRAAAELSAKHFPAELGQSALAAAERLTERADRGLDHTIVALSGGTGSGKSSLFNAIAEMPFAKVGLVRPTTTKVTACVWGTGAEELLDWLGMERGSWIKRDSVLESHIGELRGLILLDLPDYDSAWRSNHLIAERVLPLVDVLIWVTDPQKCADPTLDERFVATARAHPGRTAMVVLNQIDTVAPADGERIASALVERLVVNHLTDPIVALTSAKTGAGIDQLRAGLMGRAGHRTLALVRAEGELAAAAKELAVATEADSPSVIGDGLRRTHKAVVDALIVAAIGPDGINQPRPPDEPAVRQAVSAWMADLAHELPERWAGAVLSALASPEDLAARLEAALRPLAPPARAGFWRRLFGGAQVQRERREAFENSVRAVFDPIIGLALTGPTRAVIDDRDRLASLLAGIAAEP
ncbi:MAG: 50S ribosome-binding GTPase [Bifidobacteriaceae bacterium]|jgi:GTP-binding protein EngB required for normal cell division|nr:50S ribosome-binding GTPase [Bifidobacteriaceae bacterium]